MTIVVERPSQKKLTDGPQDWQDGGYVSLDKSGLSDTMGLGPD